MAKLPETKSEDKLENIFITHITKSKFLYYIKSSKGKTTQQKKIGEGCKLLIKKKLQISIRIRKLQ